MSSVLHLLHLIYAIFTRLDPDPSSEYGSGSTKFLNTEDPDPEKYMEQYVPWYFFLYRAGTDSL